MADTWITDLKHFLEDGRLALALPGPALRLVEYLGWIVAAVTGVDPDDPLGVRCRRRLRRRPCSGEIEGYIVPESNDIYWELAASLQRQPGLAIKLTETGGSADNLAKLEAGEVRFALAQWWNLNLKSVQPIIKIGAQTVFGERLGDRAIRRCEAE